MNVTTKGQVTIPKEIRDTYQIDESTQIDFVAEGERIYMVPRPRDTDKFTALQGIADLGLSTEAIMKMTRGRDE